MPHGRVNGAHQFAQFGGNLIFPLYIFFVFPLKILIQPVLDGYPAAGKVALVSVQTQAVFKIAATLPWTYGKRINTAGTGTGRVDGTAPIRKEDAGAVVVNSAYGVEACERGRLDNLMRDNNISVPPSDGDSGYWLKRGDAAAQSKSDVVYCKDRATLAEKEADFVIRGITNWIIQGHVLGDLVKFYAVKGGFFRYFYPSDDGESKFGDEKLNGDACHYAFDEHLLKATADKVAQITGIDVYGGDAIITEDGNFYIIDFNDWPSFSRCRDIAADAIAKLTNKKNSLNKIKI